MLLCYWHSHLNAGVVSIRYGLLTLKPLALACEATGIIQSLLSPSYSYLEKYKSGSYETKGSQAGGIRVEADPPNTEHTPIM